MLMFLGKRFTATKQYAVGRTAMFRLAAAEGVPTPPLHTDADTTRLAGRGSAVPSAPAPKARLVRHPSADRGVVTRSCSVLSSVLLRRAWRGERRIGCARESTWPATTAPKAAATPTRPPGPHRTYLNRLFAILRGPSAPRVAPRCPKPAQNRIHEKRGPARGRAAKGLLSTARAVRALRASLQLSTTACDHPIGGIGRLRPARAPWVSPFDYRSRGG